MEWAGAFGDVGTLIPFVVAYITIVKMPPWDFFSCSALLLWRPDFITEHPSDPTYEGHRSGSNRRRHKSRSALRIRSFNRAFLAPCGLTGVLRPIAKLATKPVVRGIMLGLGLTFMVDGSTE